MSKPANYISGTGRECRYVHARRKRALRKRGEEVRYAYHHHGRAVYIWAVRPLGMVVIRRLLTVQGG